MQKSYRTRLRNIKIVYFEMIALSGELSLALYQKVQLSARKIIAKEKVLRESSTNAEAKQVDELIEELRKVSIDRFKQLNSIADPVADNHIDFGLL